MRPAIFAALARTVTAAFVSLCVIVAAAQPARAETPVSVPDVALHACIADSLSQAKLASTFTAENLAQLKEVTCADVDAPLIHRLAGLEYLTGAAWIYLERTDVTDLSPLAGLTSLKQLAVCTTGKVDTSPLAGLSSITGLRLDAPNVTDVHFLSGLPGLTGLSLHVAAATSLTPLVSLSALKTLSLHVADTTPLTSLTSLSALKTFWLTTDATQLPTFELPATVDQLLLDGKSLTGLSGLPAAAGVGSLYVGQTPALASLAGIEKLGSLRKLTAMNAKISDLTPLSGLTSLAELTLDGNQIASLAPLRNLTGLITLSANNNRITYLSPLAGTGVRDLQVADNRLTTLGPAGSLSGLTSLVAGHNSLTSIDALRGATGLTLLDAADNRLTSVDALRGATALTGLDLTHNRLSNVSALSSLAPKAHVALGRNQLRDLSPLPDDATVYAPEQADMKLPDARVGKAVDLGLRSVSGRPICPRFDHKVTCTSGKVTYPASGTYFGEVDERTDNSLTLYLTQHAGPDRAFGKTYAPVINGRPVIGYDLALSIRSWSPKSTSSTYRWYRDGKKIPGSVAAGRYYRVVRADRGHRLSVCVTGHRDGFVATRRCSARTAKAYYPI